jgi:hypothetical protein
MLASLLAMPACGATSAGETDTGAVGAAGAVGLGRDRLAALLAGLTRAGPQGSISPQRAATTAARQADISRHASSGVRPGACRQALMRLASSYSTFSQSARELASRAGDARQYATSAGAVSTAYAHVERTCA